MGLGPGRSRGRLGVRAVPLAPRVTWATWAMWATWVAAVACAHARASPEVTLQRSANGDITRHAAGVAIDPPSSLPEPSPSAAAESGVVVLTEPADVRPALRAVGAFFDAVVAESMEGLDGVLDRAAHTSSPSRARPESARAAWERRFRNLDYKSLASEVLYRPSELEVHTAGDAAALGGSRALPVPPRGEEVLVRATIVVAGSSRFFGSEIVFLLRPGPSGYKIAELFEDFRLP